MRPLFKYFSQHEFSKNKDILLHHSNDIITFEDININTTPSFNL